MVLNVHSNALYLSALHVQSRSGGYFLFGSTSCDGSPIQINGTVHITSTILKLVAASTAEAELGHSSSMRKRPKSSGLSLKSINMVMG
jgi:hypothetical protein